MHWQGIGLLNLHNFPAPTHPPGRHLLHLPSLTSTAESHGFRRRASRHHRSIAQPGQFLCLHNAHCSICHTPRHASDVTAVMSAGIRNVGEQLNTHCHAHHWQSHGRQGCTMPLRTYAFARRHVSATIGAVTVNCRHHAAWPATPSVSAPIVRLDA